MLERYVRQTGEQAIGMMDKHEAHASRQCRRGGNRRGGMGPMGTPMRRPRVSALVLALLLALAPVAACVPGPPTPPADIRSVRLGVSNESLSALAYIARDQGIFEGAGLDVAFIEYSSSQLAMDALMSGEVDAALCADTPIALTAIEGDPLRIIATVGTDNNDLKIVARADAGITTPEEIAGKRIGTRQGTAAHFFLHSFLIKHGMSDSDVFVSFDSFENVTAALVAGDLDAAALREPFVSELRTALGDRYVLFEEKGLYGKTMNLCVIAGDTAPDAVVQERLVAAMLAAEELGVSDTTGQIKASVAKALKISEEDLCACIVVEGAVCLRQSLVLVLEDQMRWALDSGLAQSATRPDVLSLLDTGPLDAVAPDRVSVIR